MGNSRRFIQPVYDNSDKQLTYRTLMGRYKRAVGSEFYFEAMLIVYAMIEDRLRSFLYHIGAIRSMEDSKLNVSSTRSILRRLYFGSEEKAKGAKLDINNVSAKGNLIRATLNWSDDFNGIPEELYLEVLKEEYTKCLNIEGMLKVLEQIGEWSSYRNEVIHGLLNKNMDSLNSALQERVEEGMGYARFVDSQVKSLKRNDNIRKKMRILK